MAGWPEVSENVRAGQPILMVEAAGKQWLSFYVREDNLRGLTIGEALVCIGRPVR
jgi:HlyD family secretion protein